VGWGSIRGYPKEESGEEGNLFFLKPKIRPVKKLLMGAKLLLSGFLEQRTPQEGCSHDRALI
jgi:hypothetical protein